MTAVPQISLIETARRRRQMGDDLKLHELVRDVERVV
jgi:hypothetical protein